MRSIGRIGLFFGLVLAFVLVFAGPSALGKEKRVKHNGCWLTYNCEGNLVHDSCGSGLSAEADLPGDH